ncbi:MAG: hypothetical protein QM784_17915 [Polyangiaceae bacterium]
MKIWHHWFFCVLLSFGSGCGDPSSTIPVAGSGGDDPPTRLHLEPASELTEAEAVLAIHIDTAAAPSERSFADVTLIEGTPSAISVGKYEDGETTDALADRTVPVLLHEDVGELQLRPTGVLALGQTYSVISRTGIIGKIVVMPRTSRPYLARLWPPGKLDFGATGPLLWGSHIDRRSGGRAISAGRHGADPAWLG